jgi:predicted phosphodiesterase
VLALALVGCSARDDEPPVVAPPVIDAPVSAPVVVDKPRPKWTFAVLSDLHLPNYFTRTVDRTVAALIEEGVRFVVITGDHTNGSPLDGPRRRDPWWAAVATALRPLREAGIAVLPVAGNHDSYLPAQREGYAMTFDRAWAKPLVVNDAGESALARWPFSYSVDVDGVHLSLAHIVATRLDPGVAKWLAADLEGAKQAKHRIVFAHNPLSSVIWSPAKPFVEQLGGILDRGKVEMFVGGHEHVVWDEMVALPSSRLRQVIAGCASGYYDYAPSEPSKLRARCTPVVRPGLREPMRCQMPNGGAFELARGRKNRHLQHYKNAFVLIDVDGADLRVRPMTVDAAGALQPFYLPD